MVCFTPRLALAAALISVFALSGCREADETPITYEPGVYKGAPDQEIDEETRAKLRARARLQQFN